MKRFTCIGMALLAVAFGLSIAGCHRKNSADDETPDTSTYRPESTPVTEWEQKLKFVRDGHFQHVWIFTRKDGKAFTPDDSEVLRTNAPKVVDWVGTDDKKRFIAGSNFDLEPAQKATLLKRFNIEEDTGK